jgi:hypothetical protein
MENQFYKVRECKIKKTHKDGCEVTFPVSYEYNGGIVIKGKWYKGYEVPPPTIPKGYKLESIAVGLQLNSRPPYATMALTKIL